MKASKQLGNSLTDADIDHFCALMQSHQCRAFPHASVAKYKTGESCTITSDLTATRAYHE